jgi:hypothetical protein
MNSLTCPKSPARRARARCGARGVSVHAKGLRLRGVARLLVIAPTRLWPCALLNSVGTPMAVVSQLNTLPACAPVNASLAPSRATTQDSGSGWVALLLPCETFVFSSPRRSIPAHSGQAPRPIDRGRDGHVLAQAPPCLAAPRHTLAGKSCCGTRVRQCRPAACRPNTPALIAPASAHTIPVTAGGTMTI